AARAGQPCRPLAPTGCAKPGRRFYDGGMRILLIEDESELAAWLARGLARHGGFMVDWADDAELAERRLAVEEFDAIILDLGLPGMDGHEFLRRLREIGRASCRERGRRTGMLG